MELDLSSRKWPVRNKDDVRFKDSRITSEIARNYGVSPFVSDGRIYSRQLGYKGVAKPIPPDECAVTSLTKDSGGRIFGATSGRRTHIFVYEPKPDRDAVVDIGVIEGERSVSRSLVACPDGRIFGGTNNCGNNSGYEGGWIFRYAPSENESISIVQQHHYVMGKIEKITIPVKEEGISCMAIDDKRGVIYGVSDKSGKLFSFRTADNSTEIIGEVDETRHYSNCIIIDGDGAVWGTKREGIIYRYAEGEGIVETGKDLPSIKGREYYNRADSMIYDGRRGVICGGTDPDGLFFEMDVKTLEIKCFGKPCLAPRIRAMALGNDGRIYGVGGDRGDMAHLFEYSPETGNVGDLGIPFSTVEEKWYGYEFESMVTGHDGEIYIGESDRMSHLFIYHPRIRLR